MAYKSGAIANAFLGKALQTGESVTHLKLQKLVYLAAGYYAVAKGVPLFDCSIEAWEHGPIVPDLYQNFIEFGGAPISISTTDENGGPLRAPIEDLDAMRVVDFVWATYGKFSDVALATLANEDGSPWSRTKRVRAGVRNPDIDEKTLRDYFSLFVIFPPRPSASALGV
jgi:uncharacterized phage-associated protein